MISFIFLSAILCYHLIPEKMHNTPKISGHPNLHWHSMNTRFSYTPRILLLQIQTFQREWNNGCKLKPSQPPMTITIVDKKLLP